MTGVESAFLCIAAPLCAVLLLLKGREARRTCLFLLLGLCACLTAAYCNGLLAQCFHSTLLEVTLYIAPVTEEALKLLPVLVLFLLRNPTEAQIQSAACMTGTGFAVFENCSYLCTSGADSVFSMLIRGFAAGIMHVVCASVSGYVLSLIRRQHYQTTVSVIGIFSVVVTYHATYNLLVSVPGVPRTIGFLMPSVSVVLLLLLRWLFRNGHLTLPVCRE